MGRKSRVAEAELMLQEIQGSSFEVEPEEKEIIVEATNVFYRNQAAKARIVLNRGGRGSSKSFSLIQLMLHKFFCEDRKKICILRKSLPSLRQSVHMQMCDLANEYGLMDRIVVEKVHMNWYYNGAMIHFGSVDESSKIRSSNWNVFFIEEATEITYDEWQDIRFCLREPSRDGRRNQAYFAFNPIDEFHWIKEKIVDDPEMEEGVDYEEIVSSYRDNPFLDADSINDLVKLERQDPSLYNIFTLGNWGRLDNLIYYNWSTVPIMPSEDAMDWVSYGLDFGFNCVDEETEILTKGGWKKHQELKVGDFALTFNKETQLSEWQSVEDINRYEGLHEMRLMCNRSHSSLTTPNHRWLVKRGEKGGGCSFTFKTTDTIGCNDYVVCAARCSNIPKTKTYADSFVELVAWFWTEGQITAGGISLWQNEGETACRIRAVLIAEFGKELVQTRNGGNRAKAGWVERPKNERDQCHFAINLNGAEAFIAVAPNKIVSPEFISLLTKEQLQLFVDVSIMADGSKLKRGNGSAIGQSKAIRLDALQMAASLLGIRANLSRDLHPDCPSYKGKFVEHSNLQLHSQKNKSGVLASRDLDIGNMCQQKEMYQGVVWCPTVQNKTWLARRNGKVYFTGNSPSGLIKGYFKKPDQLWEEEMLYHTQMTNSDLIVKLKDIIPEDKRRKHIIWADSERPDCIKEINQAGFICKPAIKQIKAGIDQVKRLNCHLFEGSINLIKEKRGYSWKKDRRGNVTDEPVDFLNHLMDPERYMVHSMIAKKHGGVNIRFFD